MIESPQALKRRRAFHNFGTNVPTQKCPTCGDMFFTRVGLDEHMRKGEHAPRVTTRWVTGRLSPATLAVMKDTGRAVAALNNSRRRRCSGCDLETTPAALGSHQRFSGHAGWVAVES